MDTYLIIHAGRTDFCLNIVTAVLESVDCCWTLEFAEGPVRFILEFGELKHDDKLKLVSDMEHYILDVGLVYEDCPETKHFRFTPIPDDPGTHA